MASKRGGAPEAPVSIDMTKAVSMEPMPDNTQVLIRCDVLDIRGSKASGQRTAHVELTVIKPDAPGIINRKLFDDINLENEFTLGRLLNLLKGFGMTEEEIRKPDFVLVPEDIMGLEAMVVVGIRKSDRYGDRNSIKRVAPAEAYEAAA